MSLSLCCSRRNAGAAWWWRALTMLMIGACGLVTRAQASVDSGEAAAAAEVFRECVQRIHDRAYHEEPVAVIADKALKGLIQQLGVGYQPMGKDLASLEDSAALQGFDEVMQRLANLPGQRHTVRELTERALQAYCKQIDPWSKYIRSEDNEMIKLMNRSSSSGVGMTVRERGGFFCYPLPGSAAEAAGIKAGDKLLAVEGKPLAEKSLLYAAALIKGPPGTDVLLRVEHSFGRSQAIRVVREALNAPSLLVESTLVGQVLRIRKFDGDLVRNLREAVARAEPGKNLTIDLRGCAGGDLDMAIEVAGLFMEPGETIVTERKRNAPDKVHQATQPRAIKAPSIVLLQDEGTASAAELLIAALISSKSNRVASQGAKTYGKGVFQTIYGDLRGGGLLELTTGELIAPQGRTWEGVGLLPSLGNPSIFPKE